MYRKYFFFRDFFAFLIAGSDREQNRHIKLPVFVPIWLEKCLVSKKHISSILVCVQMTSFWIRKNIFCANSYAIFCADLMNFCAKFYTIFTQSLSFYFFLNFVATVRLFQGNFCANLIFFVRLFGASFIFCVIFSSQF